MSVTPLTKEGRARVQCPSCGRIWEGRLRENYTCSKMHGGCGSRFTYKGFKVKLTFETKQIEEKK